MSKLTLQQKIDNRIHLHARVAGYTHGLLVGMETYTQHPTDEYLGVSDERTMVETMYDSLEKLKMDGEMLKWTYGGGMGQDCAKEYRRVYTSFYATANATGWTLANPNIPVPVHEYIFKH